VAVLTPGIDLRLAAHAPFLSVALEPLRRFDHIISHSFSAVLRPLNLPIVAYASARVAQQSQSSTKPTGTSGFGQWPRTRVAFDVQFCSILTPLGAAAPPICMISASGVIIGRYPSSAARRQRSTSSPYMK